MRLIFFATREFKDDRSLTRIPVVRCLIDEKRTIAARLYRMKEEEHASTDTALHHKQGRDGCLLEEFLGSGHTSPRTGRPANLGHLD